MSIVAEIPKNTREVLRVSREEYRGRDLINMRVFFTAEDGTLRPGKQGLALRVDLIPLVMEALRAALAVEDAE